MYKFWALPIILILLSSILWADTPVTIRRVCEDARDNHLYFTPSSDPCAAYFQYKIWGRNGSSGPFVLLDSITIKTQDEYIHVNASPGIPTNWSYFIVIIDSCGPDFETISDTIFVDRQQPQIVYLDSASIDPFTNDPYLGWHNNTSPDFSHFKVYSIVGTNNILISPGQKDTFFHDLTTVTGPKTFNISSVDSCGNETPFIDSAHTTMFLTTSVDTCELEATVSWTPYIGWAGIRIYYIYENVNSSGYILIDSVFPPVTTYTRPIVLGSTNSYYVRAFRSTDGISASSNSSAFITRLRIEPRNSYLSSVSVSKPNDPTTIIHVYNPNEEVKNYSIQASQSEFGTYTQVGTITGGSSAIQNYSLTIPFVATQKYFKAVAQNSCGISFEPATRSRYSSLTAAQGGNANNLTWESYFTWNVGVDYYNIYRGTNDANGNIIFSLLDAVPNTDTIYSDQNLPSIVGENGLCYYVEAIQAPGDINLSIETALSTMMCIVGEVVVYIPNAFNPFGANKTFRPEGSYIDYDHSKMELYDRWGKQLTVINGIRAGWDGKDSDGVLCMQGVYLYQLYIISTNGQKQTFSGTVTLLN